MSGYGLSSMDENDVLFEVRKILPGIFLAAVALRCLLLGSANLVTDPKEKVSKAEIRALIGKRNSNQTNSWKNKNKNKGIVLIEG